MAVKFKFKLSEFVFLLMLIFSGVNLSFSSGGFVVNFQQLGFTVLSSLQSGVNYVVSGITETFSAVKELQNLKKENLVLTQKLKNYELLQRSNVEIKKENERLREQLNFAATLEQKNYPAQIIGRNPDSFFSGITINKGSTHGIKKGMPVVAVQNGITGLVGKVVTVGATTSIIMPVYDSKCSVSCRIQNTRDLGLLSGNGNFDSPLSLRYIKKRVAEELNEGDIIITSGETQNYIKDIPVGRISKIKVLDYDSSLEIEVIPIIDFSRLETVIVTDLKQVNENYSGK